MKHTKAREASNAVAIKAERAALPAMLHPEQRLRYPQVCTLVGLAQNSINELVKAGEFPQPERDGRRCTRWRAGDVLDYLAARRERLLAQTAAPEPTVITTRRRKARA